MRAAIRGGSYCAGASAGIAQGVADATAGLAQGVASRLRSLCRLGAWPAHNALPLPPLPLTATPPQQQDQQQVPRALAWEECAPTSFIDTRGDASLQDDGGSSSSTSDGSGGGSLGGSFSGSSWQPSPSTVPLSSPRSSAWGSILAHAHTTTPTPACARMHCARPAGRSSPKNHLHTHTTLPLHRAAELALEFCAGSSHHGSVNSGCAMLQQLEQQHAPSSSVQQGTPVPDATTMSAVAASGKQQQQQQPTSG